jgi:hypothetical protein
MEIYKARMIKIREKIDNNNINNPRKKVIAFNRRNKLNLSIVESEKLPSTQHPT